MLDRVQAIRRHVQGSRRYTAWTPSTYRAGLAGVLRQWRADVRQLAEDGGSTTDLLNPSKSKHGYDSWVHCTWEQVNKKAEKAFVAVRNMLHGRKRSDRRAQFRGFMAKLERERKEGRIRRAVTTLTGRSSKGGFAMDSVVHQGVTLTDPVEVASLTPDGSL